MFGPEEWDAQIPDENIASDKPDIEELLYTVMVSMPSLSWP